jgi:hypothetical protein
MTNGMLSPVDFETRQQKLNDAGVYETKGTSKQQGRFTKMPSRKRHDTEPAAIVPDALVELDRRLAQRFSRQPDVPDLLPATDVDLNALSLKIVERTAESTPRRRSDMTAQKTMLTNTFAGRTELELLHALVISYLRRETPHTEKAWAIFQRIWAEQSSFMIAAINARWIISALQTFYDHSEDIQERTAGVAGFLYGNLIKVYETEYAARQRKRTPDASHYKNRSVPGLSGFTPGDDILININVIMLEAAKHGGLASKPLMALLEIIASSRTIFQRTDALHAVAPFSEHPTFTLSFRGRIK